MTHHDEIDASDVRSSQRTEYGVRDLGGAVVTHSAWLTPQDVINHLRRMGLRSVSLSNVLARTTTTTVTTTGWEAAR